MAFCLHGVSSGATALFLGDFDRLKFLYERMFGVMDLRLLYHSIGEYTVQLIFLETKITASHKY
jgi:hypothetical protein